MLEVPNPGMSNSDLIKERLLARQQGDLMRDRLLAPMDHKAFAREYVQENPLLGPPAMAAITPAYYAAKKMGFDQKQGASPASIDQLFGGLEGVMQGVRQNRMQQIIDIIQRRAVPIGVRG